MFPSYEKKPNKTSWFSSLRRQPKAKKNNHADKKPDPSGNHGRSCGNLTTTNCSTTASPNHINQYETNKNRLNEQHHGVQTSSSNTKDGKQLTNGSANNFQTGRYDTILCKKCMAEWRSNALIDVQLCDLVRKRECSYNIKTYNTIVDDVNVKTKLTTINSGGSTPSSPTKSINGTDGNGSGKWHKQVQQVTTKTTFTEKATFLAKQSHRVGLVFNDNGELLSNVDALRTLKQFAEKTGTVISVNNNVKKSTITWGSSDNLISPTKELPLTSNKLLECDDIEFIDSSSTSPSDVSSGGDLISDRSTDRLITKVCSSCKTKFKSKSDWNLSNKEQIKDELCEVVSEMEKLEVQDDYKHSNKDKQMSIGRKKFNMDPKKGIEYLCENHLLQMDPQDIADFLYKGEGLNKTAIGDYLGEKNDFNEQVLKAFVDLHDFTNLILVQALRQFLWSFRLPGEAQKIDRMMECFAQRYCQLNPDIFTNTDTCYVLSFAIIMLNTSLHNPSVRDKPSVEQFIALNRGINNGGDLPRELLESLYESIKTEPFKIPQDDGNDLMHTFFNPDKEGWLWKQGGRYKSWKRRWFILNDNCLYYFEYTTDKEPRGIIPLENINVREIQDRNKPYCFELYATSGADIIKACKTDSEGKVVEGKHTVYRMSAATQEDQLEWMKCLKQSISHNPFYDILVQRKKKALAKS